MSSHTKIPLYGFNNLTKSLNFSLYRVHYLATSNAIENYHSYINQCYSSENLTHLLTKICHAIGGNVLNIANQDYEPQGASATLMISEEAQPESLVAHLDKSHLCIHTYPEETPQQNIAIFRADIELSTCGVISPLNVLEYVVNEFSADVVDIDYRVRGMTRDKQGHKHFNDHDIESISEHLTQKLLAQYQRKESALPAQNLFHCRLKRKDILLPQHVFNFAQQNLSSTDELTIQTQLLHELTELYLA